MGLRIEVALLAGRYAAADPATGLAEFPPHPARCFAALTAAWAHNDPTDAAEADALRWLERQPAPTITAQRTANRAPVGRYVPVNDNTLTQADRKHGITAAMKSLPVERKTAPRESCPSVGIDGDLIVFYFDSAPPEGIFAALERLAGRMTRLGSAESLAACRARRGALPAADWTPCASDDPSRVALRVCYRGMFGALTRRHENWLNGSERGPLPSEQCFYAPTAPTPVWAADQSVTPINAGVWIALEVTGPARRRGHLGAAAMGKALRDALIGHAPQPPHPVIHGHNPDGSPARFAHAMWLTLPYVGNRGDGTTKAMAVVLPTNSGNDAQAAVSAALSAWERSEAGGPLRLLLGAAGTVELRRPRHESELPGAGRRNAWDGPARVWVSVTPLALPARSAPKLSSSTPSDRRTAETGLARALGNACENVGLPAPRQAFFSRSPLTRGAVHASEWAHYRGRWPVHAAVEFDEPVNGPVVLGDARHFGLGLMRPAAQMPFTAHQP